MNNLRETQHFLPYELEGMPEDEVSIGEMRSFSNSEVNSFHQYDKFLEGLELYLGDGKNIYQVRKRWMQQDNEVVLTADCVGVCNPDEYELIMENEDGFSSVVGYVESDFAFYTEEDGFTPSPAETKTQNELDHGSKAANSAVRKVLED